MKRGVAVLLAAGKGTRMKSDLPKVLTPLCGRPMIDYVVDALVDCGLERLLVVAGYRKELVAQALAARPQVTIVTQEPQLGTAHAVMVCRDELKEYEGPVLVVTGDSPMIQRDSVSLLLDDFGRDKPACLLGTAHKDDPTGLGRICRDAAGDFTGIVEEKDASPEQRRITEVNMSTYVFNCSDLLYALDHVQTNNKQGEYYLTDCPGILKRSGRTVRALPVLKQVEALSINTPEELAVVEAVMRGDAS